MARYGLDLGRNRSSGARKKTALIIGFICLVLVIGSVSLLLLWRSLNYDFGNIFNTNESTTETITTTEAPEGKTFSGNYTFLCAITSDDGKEVRFLTLAEVRLQDKTIRLFPLSRSIKTKDGTTLEKLYLTSGVTELRDALDDLYNINIARYAVFTDTGCKGVFNAFGNINIDIPEQVEYDTDDMYLELNKGANVLTPDKAYKYVRFLCEKDDSESAKRFSELAVAALESYYTTESYSDSELLFTSVVNRCDTDITIVDYTDALEEIASMLPSSANEKLKAYVTKSITDTEVVSTDGETR